MSKIINPIQVAPIPIVETPIIPTELKFSDRVKKKEKGAKKYIAGFEQDAEKLKE